MSTLLQVTLRFRRMNRNGIANTHLGYLLYRADVALKEYVLGSRLDGTELHSAVTVYPKMLESLRQEVTAETPYLARFWLEADPHLAVDSDDRVALVKSAGVKFKATASPEWKAQFAAFAEAFTEHFPQFTRESDSLNAFVDIVHIVAVARWLADAVPEEGFQWIQQRSSMTYKTPERLPVVRIKRTERDAIAGSTKEAILMVGGGILLRGDSSPKITTDASLNSLASAIEDVLGQEGFEPVIRVQQGEDRYTGYVITLTGK